MTTASDRRAIYAARDEVYDPQPRINMLRRGVDGVCSRSSCICERGGLGDQCIWLRHPSDPIFEQPIHTEPADLDDTKRSTEAGAGFIVAVVVTALAICAGLFLAGVRGWL